MSGLTRRQALGVAGASVIGATVGARGAGAGASAATSQTLQDWPMHQFDRGHTGHNPEAVGVTSSPSRLWEFDTGADISQNAGATLVDRRLYVANEEGILRVLNADEGREIWRFDLGASSVMTTPALGEGLVFVGGESAPLYALDPRDEEVVWTREFRNGNFVGSPTYADDTLYVARHELFALEAATGEVRWRAPEVSGVEGCVALADGVAYAFGTESGVYAVDADEGSTVWSRSLPSELQADHFETTVADGRVYVGGWDGSVYALSADTGETLWRFQPESGSEDQYGARSSPAIYDGTVVVGSQDGNVYSLSADDGSVRWSFEAGQRVVCSPSVADGVAYVGGLGGRFYALSADDGRQLWSYGEGEVRSSCVVSGGRVFFPTREGHVVALRGDGSGSDGGGETDADGDSGGIVRTPPDDGGGSTDDPGATDGSGTTDAPRRRGFFSNSGDGPAVLENVFNLTVLGFVLSIAGIVHQMIQGR